MCGIFAVIGKKTDAPNQVLAGLKSLEYRGYDSWGVAVVPNNKQLIVIKKRAGKIGNAHVDDLPAGVMAFGHTRWATHGGVTDANAHPHVDCKNEIALIHNGIIENYETLRKELSAKQHQFKSETDTETAVHLIEELVKNLSFPEAVRSAFNQMTGLNAIIVMDTKNAQFVAVRNGSPLVIGFGQGENFIASDAAALLPHTKEVHFMEDDEMAVISQTQVALFNVRTGKKLALKKQTLRWTVEQAHLGNHPHFMIKEIHEQPKIIAAIAETGAPEAEKMANAIKQAFGSYLVGCGTAGHACIAGAYLFSKIAKFHLNWAIGSEFGYEQDFLTKKSLVLALSQSGETMDTLEAVRKAKHRGAQIATLVNVLGSSLYREADHKIVIGAGPEKSVASTKAFSGKIAHLLLIAYALARKTSEGQDIVAQASQSVQKVLSDQSLKNIQKLAVDIKNAPHLYVIGRGLSYPTALETALKIKEISYIHAEGFAAGELKHGTLALIEKGTPCIVFAPNDETYHDNLSGAMEMKARGGMIIGISHKPSTVFDYFLEVADTKEGTIIPNVVVGQLLAYYLTLERGLDPDKPRNLAKSVTVK